MIFQLLYGIIAQFRFFRQVYDYPLILTVYYHQIDMKIPRSGDIASDEKIVPFFYLKT
jgi:hypothetical protein